jgi:hypothetical protein
MGITSSRPDDVSLIQSACTSGRFPSLGDLLVLAGKSPSLLRYKLLP